MGAYALAAPKALIRPFGIALESPVARSEVRAVYGGFGLAIAVVLAYAAFRDGDVRKGMLITIGIALAGMALGRIVSAMVDARTPFYPNWFYCIVEAVAAAALFAVS
jgi:ABC-type phosphate/phosphonate transport system permease subunit